MNNQIIPEDSSSMLIGRDYVVDKDGVVTFRTPFEIAARKVLIGMAIMGLILAAIGWMTTLPLTGSVLAFALY
jgi:hypothetical protein